MHRVRVGVRLRVTLTPTLGFKKNKCFALPPFSTVS